MVFHGIDQGEEIVRPGTPLDYKYTTNFARSMPVADAMNPVNLLWYEMNGTGLPAANGFPLRLIAPGWYGVANVKWLTRIELVNKRFLNRFMGRDYVTIRGVRHGDKTIIEETSVGRMLLKSAPARVFQIDGRCQIEGAAWGPTSFAGVEVKIDNGRWMKAKLAESKSPWSWRFWSLGRHATPRDPRLPPRRLMQRAISSRRWTIRLSPTKRRAGGVTVRSRARSVSSDASYRPSQSGGGRRIKAPVAIGEGGPTCERGRRHVSRPFSPTFSQPW